MSSTYAYHTSNLVWVVAPGKPLTSFERFKKPFHPKVWTCLILTFFIGVCVITVINCQSRRLRNFVYGANINYPMLNMINIMLGGALNILPRRNFARFILGLFMMYSLVMRNAYTGSLFQFLKASEQTQEIRNMEDMRAANYSFMVLAGLRDFIDNFPVIANRSVTLKISEFKAAQQRLLNPENKLALLASEDHVAYWNKKSFPEVYFEICPEKVSSMNLVIYLHKTSCLTPEFSRQVMHFNSIGLLQILKQFYVNLSFIKKRSIDNEPKKFTLKHFEGAFFLLGTGIAASAVCFLIEIMSNFFKNVRARYY